MDHCLVVKGLSKNYDSLPVLDNWNLSLNWGQRLVFLGPSGAGKTTFLKSLAGREEASQGHIENYCRKIGFVFQEPRLIPWRSVKENLLFINPRGDFASLLSRLRLAGFEDYFPSQLSAGMKQRVNLARALIIQPDLLILDEAFSSLDLSVKTSIMENMSWEPCHFDTLLDKTGFDFGHLSILLLNLELKGIVQALPGNYYVKL
jgi:NitT/TauT family transport system ATP-binding protein